ncbi:hypothetical protein [Vibrio intestinalis]|nr:hypothetical protein [Vibrio intestinalis]
MFIVARLAKLAVISVVFFTIFDLVNSGHISWPYRLMAALGF